MKAPPPPIPSGKASPRVPYLTIATLVLGVVALTSGFSVLYHDWTCHTTSCDQPNAITIGMMVWGAVALLTGVRGRVGAVALIIVVVSPLAVGWTNPWLFLIGLLILLSAARGSKDQLAPYYRWQRGES